MATATASSSTSSVTPDFPIELDEPQVRAFITDLAPYCIELHLSPDPELPRKYGKAIKAAGGNYRTARGYAQHRYVTMPNSAWELINKLVREYSSIKVTMIARPDHDQLPAGVAVSYVPSTSDDPMRDFEIAFARKVLRARSRGDDCGRLTKTEVAAYTADAVKAAVQEKERRQQASLLYAAMPRSMDELDALADALTQYIENSVDEDEMDPVTLKKVRAATALLERANTELAGLAEEKTPNAD